MFKANLHITEKCNFNCRHCYAKFHYHVPLSVDDWKKIIDNCCNSGLINAFNFAGGEPFVYRGLEELIHYAYNKGTKVSIITNGYFMTEDWIRKNVPFLDTIGFSIDSFYTETLKNIGRCDKSGKYLDPDKFSNLVMLIKKLNPNTRIKINTVVSALNINENIFQDIINRNLPVDRLKLLKISPFENDEFNNFNITITDDMYSNYIKRSLGSTSVSKINSMIYKTENDMEIVAEYSISGGYIMIDAGGRLVDDTLNTNYTIIANCTTTDFSEALKSLSFNQKLYAERYTS